MDNSKRTGSLHKHLETTLDRISKSDLDQNNGDTPSSSSAKKQKLSEMKNFEKEESDVSSMSEEESSRNFTTAGSSHGSGTDENVRADRNATLHPKGEIYKTVFPMIPRTKFLVSKTN